MDIHEYQAKEILARFGVPVPKGALAYSPEQAAYRAREIGGKLLGRQGAGPHRRPRQGWRRQALPQRGRGAGGRRRPARQEAGDASVRPRRQDRLPPLCRRRRRHREGALSGLRARPQVGARDGRRLIRGRHGDRGDRRREAAVDRQGQRRARRRHAGLPGPRDRLRARPRAERRSSRPSTPSSAATAPSRNSTRPWWRSTR